MKKNLLDQPLFRIIVPPIYGLMMYFLILLLNNSLAQITETVFTQELLLCVVLAFLTSEPLRFTITQFEKKVGHELRRTGHITLLFFTSFLITAAIIFGVVYYYFSEIESISYFEIYQSNLIKLVSIYSISGLLYTLFYLSIYFLSIKNETEIKREDLKRQNLEHQLEIFNNEINPSLLFQSLETLISLVDHNTDLAEDFVDRLSMVYRYILDNRKKELVSAKAEIEATQNLFLLFKERYPDQISLSVDKWKAEGQKLLVPNSLPMLLDCVVNSTIISAYQPLHIKISVDEEGYLVMQYPENDKLSLDKTIKKRHKNLHEAFAFFTDKPVIQIKAYGDAFIKLPLLEFNE